jgi:adenosylcobinamide kinase/adenosylcobinamide-phosphate guanylyltransferase
MNTKHSNNHSVTLILGGARSGKSSFAQTLAEHCWQAPLYLATAEILDHEMEERIRLHKTKRGPRWACLEEPLNLAQAITQPHPGRDGILVDCLTLWLSNVLLKEGAPAVKTRKTDLLQALTATPTDIILVSNEVGMGIVPDSELGREFRDLQGWLNQDVATVADTVVFIAAGLPLMLKGSLPS